VAYLLKAGIVEPEKWRLLVNGSDTTFVSRQRLGENVPAATDKHVTMAVLLETMFSTRPVQRGYKEDNWGNRVSYVPKAVKKMDRSGSWNGAAVRRGLESKSGGTATVRSHSLKIFYLST
jgi:hypothetical protein